MNAILFKNFSNEDFTWKFDGVAYTFKAGQEMYMEEPRAKHFAKHLVDRELNTRGIPTNNMSEVAKLAVLALPSLSETVTIEEATDIEAKKTKKVGRPKKVEQEEEFSELNK